MSYPAQEYAAMFLSHRQPLLELLEQIPADQGEFKMYPNGLSIRQQVDQLFGFDAEVLSAVSGQRPDTAASADLRSATARLQHTTSILATGFASMSQEQLDSVLELDGDSRKIYQWLDFVREHEVHHKGQLWIAARMLGIEPPYYVKS